MKKLEINKQDLKNNLNIIKEILKKDNPKTKIIGVVKANGMGLDLVQYSSFLIENEINILAVANLEEALTLRKEKISQEILMLTPCTEEEDLEKLIQNNITITIGNIVWQGDGTAKVTVTTDITEIESTGDNEFEYTRVTNEQACRIYLDMLKELLLTDPESAFAKLDETYRNERFSSYEEFLSYIEGNRIRLEDATLDEYEVVNKDEYTEYRIIDNNNNNYIIRATTVMDYAVQLDAYTIQTEEYQEQYANLADVQKASVNVDLFIRMLNARDYSHAYNVLSEGFRNNYFPTEQDFINYVQENFYDYIIFTNNSHTNEGDVYIFNVTLIGGASSAAESQERTFNILLGEGTDFTLSFNME